ncbi:MAG: periplasmic heavy metal sensor [Spongiibacteraceae bacterium]
MNSHRIWGVALGVSLTINAFCLAVLLTGWLAPPHEERRGPLPPQARALFEQVAPHRQPGFREAAKAIRQQRMAVRSALVAKPFDATNLSVAFAALRETENAAAVRAHQRIVDVAATLPLEGRRQLSKLVGRRPGKPPRPPHGVD